ncbi:hypothetical protein D3C81_1989700 [compost metagenome]
MKSAVTAAAGRFITLVIIVANSALVIPMFGLKLPAASPSRICRAANSSTTCLAQCPFRSGKVLLSSITATLPGLLIVTVTKLPDLSTVPPRYTHFLAPSS